jgi:probable phosphoglycerate mutase
VRHGESAWNAEERLQGQSDPALSDVGRRQSEALRAGLAQLRVDRVVVSDLARARETAALAGFPDARPDRAWRENDIGVWSGRLASDLDAGELQAWRRGEHVPQGGETWPDFARRVSAAADALRDAGGTTLVFTHGGCVRAATAHVTGARAVALAGPANASVTLLELAPRARLLAYNRAEALAFPVPSEPGGTSGTPA